MTFLGLLILGTAGFANDPDFLQSYFQTRGYSLGRPVQATMTADGSAVLFLRAKSAKEPKLGLYQFDVASGKTEELVTPEDLLHGKEEKLSDEEKARRERQRIIASGISNFKLDPNDRGLLIQYSGKVFVVDRITKKFLELPIEPGITDVKWSPDGQTISYIRDHDVWIFQLRGAQEVAVTHNGSATLTHGVAEFVAQEEMGRSTGYWWSPDSKYIAYTEANHEGVETWDIADPSQPGTGVRKQFYPRPGEKNVKVRLGITQITQSPTVWVDPDWIDYEYLAAVHWDKVGGLTMQIQNRSQTVHKLLSVDPDNGSVSELLTEEVPTWFNINQSVPKWVDADRFLWISDVAGDSQLQLIDTRKQGAERRKSLTEKGTQVSGVVQLVPKEGGSKSQVVVQASNADSLSSTPWIIEVEDGFTTTPYLNAKPNVVTMEGSDDLKVRLVTAMSLSQMPETMVQTADGKTISLPSLATTPTITPNVTMEKLDTFWTAILWPRDFDNSKKYPVIVDIYGGPHHSHVVPSMKNYLIPQWLADQGFIVVAIENRGTPDKGRDLGIIHLQKVRHRAA